ncbi:MAG: hypothetical protein JWP11_910, partial [Frankiales bacterium]|nr:hypothetical protein [Frankiales bacterium]
MAGAVIWRKTRGWGVAAKGSVRRPGWALPPQPPETWVGGVWLSAFAIALAVAVFVPIAPVWHGGSHDSTLLADARALAAVAAVLAGFALIVQALVIGDRWLRWVAGGYGLALLLVLGQVGSRSSYDLLEALSILTLLAVPLFALTAPLVRRGLPLVVLPATALAAAAAVAAAARPDLLDGGELRTSARLLWVAVALVSAAAAAS